MSWIDNCIAGVAARTTNKRPKEPMEKLRYLRKDREVK